MKCPHCNEEINVGRLLGSIKSPAKAAASRLNGFRPKKKRPTCQHISGCSNPGFQSKGRTIYLCKEHS